MTIRILHSRTGPPTGPLLLIHGGAGPRSAELELVVSRDYQRGLELALDAGSSALQGGGSALDAVCAAVVRLEDDPLFNAGRGASLTSAGTAEMDAAVMTGDGRAGAVAVSRHVRNPVLAARAVRDHTEHVLLVDPSEDLSAQWGLVSAAPEYFVTDHRRHQLDAVLAKQLTAPRHGTVGAVAIDRDGRLACATSTGGMVGQAVGRVGDTAVIGAGSYADSESVAVSCTGEGEAFIRGVVAHDIAARVGYRGDKLEVAVRATYERELERLGATGGTIALTPDGDALIMHNSTAMFAGYWEPTAQRTFI